MQLRPPYHFSFALLTALAIALSAALAAKEELVTLPERDGVTLTIYNSVDLTFVRERRTLSFKEGENLLQFSWANTLIDPTSVEFSPARADAGLEIVTTTYPAESGEMLIWTIAAAKAGDQAVEISYFTSGISWSADYAAVLTPRGDGMSLTGHVTVNNQSGEDYPNAVVRLIIGNINLVESIRFLAERAKWNAMRRMFAEEPAPNAPAMPCPGEDGGLDDLRNEARDEWSKSKKDDRNNARLERVAKEIEKQSLGEYFMYTVGGVETIPTGWGKRLVAVKPVNVPCDQVYYYKPVEFGPQLVRVQQFKNDKEHQLGNEPLPNGTVKFYTDAGEGRLGFVASVEIKYLPVGDEAKWNLGADPRVTMKTATMKHRRENLSFERRTLTGHDIVNEEQLEVHNYRDVPVKFEIHLRYGHDDYDWISRGEGAQEDAFTTKWNFELAAGAERKIDFALRFRHGSNRKVR